MRENYVGQIFGTREIIKNDCTLEDWIKSKKSPPKDISRYRLAKCLVCGEKSPCLVSGLKKNPPKRCSFCSGINYQGNKPNRTNTWVIDGKIAICNVTFKEKIVSFVIDSEDYGEIKEKIWRVSQKKNKYYIVSGSKETQVYLHRFIFKNILIPEGYEIDHIDGNSLNNRKENLRVVTRLENIQNVGVRIDNQIGIRGIIELPSKRFQVDFSFNKKRYYFKSWSTIEEAIYCRLYLEKLFGLEMGMRNPIVKKYKSPNINTQKEIEEYISKKISGN